MTSLMATENEDLHASGGGLDSKDEIEVDNDPDDGSNVATNEKEDKGPAESNDANSDDPDDNDSKKKTMDKVWSKVIADTKDSDDRDEDEEEDEDEAKTRDPIMQEISVRLECCKFRHAVPTPIQQCINGHLICKSCLIGINKSKNPTCPECDVGLRDAVFTNLALGNMASHCVVPCRYEHCDVKCAHSDLDNHLQYCSLPAKRKENMDPEDFDWKATDAESDDAGIRAMAIVAREINCNFCNEATPPPIQQCKSGHVACSYCLERMRRADSPTCPFCQVDISVTGRNLHLEEMASSHSVKCRWEGCEKEMKYPELSEHLATCESQPILCAACDAKAESDARYVSWDAMWEHYKAVHLGKATPTELDNMVLKDDHIRRMLDGKLGFITWGHSLNANGEPVRVFPGMYYSKERETFYFTIRIMAPLLAEEDDDDKTTFGLVVSSPTSPVRMVGHFPAISYRTPHKYTINSPCLAISVATMELMTEGGDGIIFEVKLPEGGGLTLV